MVYFLGHMFYTLVGIHDFFGNLVQASKKFQEEVGDTEVVSKLETGNVSLLSHTDTTFIQPHTWNFSWAVAS
jgi:hypothetical protein